MTEQQAERFTWKPGDVQLVAVPNAQGKLVAPTAANIKAAKERDKK